MRSWLAPGFVGGGEAGAAWSAPGVAKVVNDLDGDAHGTRLDGRIPGQLGLDVSLEVCIGLHGGLLCGVETNQSRNRWRHRLAPDQTSACAGAASHAS